MHKTSPLRRALAAMITGALIAAASVAGIALPAQAASASVSAPAVPRDGATVTVTGTGFDASGFGIYLGVRADGSSSDSYTVWIDDTNVLGGSGGLFTAPMSADGAFSVDVPVPAYSGTGYSIITRGAHGIPNTTNTTSTPIVYEAAPAASTATALTLSPASGAVEGADVVLSASVSPADAVGTVEFFSGTTSLGSSPVAQGAASLSLSALPVGTLSLSAVFTSADSAAFTGSSSAPVAYTVTAKPSEPSTPVFHPAVSVFLADGVTPYAGQPVTTGDTLVVKGTGFDPAANVGGRGMPIPNTLPQGIYVAFGSFLPQWQPSAKIPGTARKAVDTKWALAESVLLQVPAQFQSTVRGQWASLGADGSFQTTLTAKDFASGLSGGNWGVYTYGAGGVSNAAQELSVPVNYVGDAVTPAPPTVNPQVTVTPSTPIDPSSATTLTVSGTGFTGPGAANGVYVLFGEAGHWAGGSAPPADGWVVSGYVPGIRDGAFTTTLKVPAGVLDPAKTYQVATTAAHALSLTDRSLDTFTPVAVAAPSQSVPKAFIGNDGGSVVQGGVLTVTGTGFAAGTAVTAVAHSEPVTIGTVNADALGTAAFSWQVPADFAPGEHTVELSANGAVVASVPLTVTAAPAPAAAAPTAPVVECVAQSVSGAWIDWGFKSSFVNYIQTTARGSVSGGWGAGSGAYNADAGRGSVSYGGSVHYTGHNGVLDITLASPTIQVHAPGSATLYASVNGNRIALAALSLPAASTSGGEVSWQGASATLTSAGADAFSFGSSTFYPAGTALDSVSFGFPLGAKVPCDSSTDGALAVTSADSPTGALWLGASLLVLGAGLVAVRRRRARV